MRPDLAQEIEAQPGENRQSEPGQSPRYRGAARFHNDEILSLPDAHQKIDRPFGPGGRDATSYTKTTNVLSLAVLLLCPVARADAAFDHAAVLAQASAVYGPLLARQGLRLVIVEDRRGMISARADIVGGDAVVGVDIGVYDSPALTEDAFRFMLCHELGHLVGAPPRRPAPLEYEGPIGPDGLMLVSSEGQADYYASLKCMRLLLEGADHAALESRRPPAPRVTTLCARQFPSAEQSALCRRVAMAGLEFLRGMSMQVPIDFETPSPEIAERTFAEYPSRQCRLDTILAGALCRIDPRVEPSRDDPTAGACRKDGDPLGARPGCWYKE